MELLRNDLESKWYVCMYYMTIREPDNKDNVSSMWTITTVSWATNYNDYDRFMFKNLVKVKIYIAEQKSFVNLNEEVIADLDLERDYLCRMELYESGQLGIKTPNLFKTSIYNRHFILTA